MDILQAKQNLRRIPLELFNMGKLEVADEVIEPDYIEHDPAPGFGADVAGLKQFVTMLRTAFPDLHYSIDKEVAEGDMVVFYLNCTGTMKGDFLGMKATNTSASWPAVHLARVSDQNKLIEHWAVIDQLGMLRQLGIIPVPGK